MKFSRIFKDLRKDKGLKQTDIANIFEVDRSTISKWEQGTNKPTADLLEDIANYFNVSIDYLMGRQQVKDNYNTFRRNERSMQLLEEYTKLNDLGKHEAVKRIKELSLIPSYRGNEMPIAAHSEGEINEEEMKLMREDLDEL